MILTISKNRLERFPVNPARLPAVLKSWHGKPPTTMSASPRCAWKVRTSSKRATCGQCSASTARHCGSLSTCATTVWPACSKAMSNPPMPANREMILTLSPQLQGDGGCSATDHRKARFVHPPSLYRYSAGHLHSCNPRCPMRHCTLTLALRRCCRLLSPSPLPLPKQVQTRSLPGHHHRRRPSRTYQTVTCHQTG